MELCIPVVSDEVVRAATPEPLSEPVPSTVVPSLKVTVPVGVPVAGAVAVTVAVKVTVWPKAEGFVSDVTVVDVLAAFTVMFGLVLAVFVLSVASEAVIVQVPVVFSFTLKLFVPATRAASAGSVALVSVEVV
jgi:hypothetical protein